MELRALAVLSLGAALLLTAPLGALAEPPPVTPSTGAATGPVNPPEADGQTVTLTGPFEPPPPPRSKKKPASPPKTAAPPPQPSPNQPAAPRRRAVSPPPARQRSVARSVAKPLVRVHGGPSRRVADLPAFRGGGSAVVAEPLPSASPQVARAALAPAVADAKPHSSTNWWVPLVIAVGSLLFLVALRFAYRGWAIRRSNRQWAKHFDKVHRDT
jgi:hypothetical protein